MNIKRILKEKGMTQKELAEKMNIAPSTLSRAINGNTTYQTLSNIAMYLGVSVRELVETEEERREYERMLVEITDIATQGIRKRAEVQSTVVMTFSCPHCGEEMTITIEPKKKEENRE